jgi:hypothetical protein
MGSDPDRATAAEKSERNLFHRPSLQAACESRVVYDLTVADMDAVMQIATTRCDYV